MGLMKVSASGPENSPGEVEGRAITRKFLTNYLTYTPANVERQYAEALNMMTLNFRQLTMNKFREDDILGKVKTDAITSSQLVMATSLEAPLAARKEKTPKRAGWRSRQPAAENVRFFVGKPWRNQEAPQLEREVANEAEDWSLAPD